MKGNGQCLCGKSERNTLSVITTSGDSVNILEESSSGFSGFTKVILHDYFYYDA